MSRRHDIDTRLESLGDIAKIMGSMKNLSLMETHKLARFIDSQGNVVVGAREAALDLLDHHPDLIPPAAETGALYALIGSERGFCGGFNGAVKETPAFREGGDTGSHRLVVVGRRLGNLLEGDPAVAEILPGASAVEDIPAVLRRLAETLDRLVESRIGASLIVVHWEAAQEIVVSVPLLPPFGTSRGRRIPLHASPPLIQLPPAELLAELIEHYLLAALHRALYSSLLAEHRQRARHLEGALGRIDRQVQRLRQQRNTLRQEEITEEIELILLNLQGNRPPGADRKS